MRVLITGSEGLIGRALAAALEARGIGVRRFDLRRSRAEDVRAPAALADGSERHPAVNSFQTLYPYSVPQGAPVPFAL